ncbi:MAG: hypothetical protein A2V88_00620 [Elusimicrobia bacterium RBG_16_66_12]|nr:MAG: hypothetical protein A2V88_00620 [Elusimicrobia bacterium RBG_16_66_12]
MKLLHLVSAAIGFVLGAGLLVIASAFVNRHGPAIVSIDGRPEWTNTVAAKVGTIPKDPAHLSKLTWQSDDRVQRIRARILTFAVRGATGADVVEIDSLLLSIDETLRWQRDVRVGYMVALGMPQGHPEDVREMPSGERR